MRTMVTIRLPVESGNRAIKDGTLPKIIAQITERIRPESCYFYIEHGKRTMRAVCDLKDVSDMPATFEPVLLALDAELEFTPVMNADELAAGLKKAFG
jgi:hypothetical protein